MKGSLREALAVVVIAILLPLIIVWVLVYALFRGLAWAGLTLLVWVLWLPRGRNVLFVYSDSPNWHEYLAENVLPKIEQRCVVLNWSERSQWGCSPALAVRVFRFFGGDREFNPMAVVFRPLRTPKTVRFFQAFRDYKHGKPERLQKAEAELYRLVGCELPAADG